MENLTKARDAPKRPQEYILRTRSLGWQVTASSLKQLLSEEYGTQALFHMFILEIDSANSLLMIGPGLQPLTQGSLPLGGSHQ